MTLTTDLSILFEESSTSLPSVTKRRMFGCDAFFANTNIFGLIWKTGRLGVRLPDPILFAELMAQTGSDPWSVYNKPGGKPMAHWILVPESMHDDSEELERWIAAAYQLALTQRNDKPKAKPAPKQSKAIATKKKPAAVLKKKKVPPKSSKLAAVGARNAPVKKKSTAAKQKTK
jgi:TfoX/Sxy family transcriptional regulator of competence genes